MNAFGIYESEQEKFVNFRLDIFVNLQKIASVFNAEICYQTKFTDIFQSVKSDLVEHNVIMNECDDHHFVFINDKGEEEQLFHADWNQYVKDINVFRFENNQSPGKYLIQTMKLEQTHGCLDTNQYTLEKMIGIKKNLMVSVIPTDELSLFEDSSRKLFVDGSKSFANMSLEEKLLIEHPINMIKLRKTYQGEINIKVYLDQSNFQKPGNKLSDSTFHNKSMLIRASDTVAMVIENALSKFKDWSKVILRQEDYLLRIAEREEYLISIEPVEIIRFQYISSCVKMNIPSNLILVPRKNLEKVYCQTNKGPKSPPHKIEAPSCNENAHKHQSLNNNYYIYIHDLWKQFKKSSSCNSIYDNAEGTNNEGNVRDDTFDHILNNFEFTDLLYGVKITSIEYPVSCALLRDQKAVILAGLYHGEKSLCEHQYREWSTDIAGCEIIFPLEVWNLPRMTRFCFALIVVKQNVLVKDVRNIQQKKFIGWGNLMIYDHKSVLKVKSISYRLWPNAKPNLNPTDSVYSNPDGELLTPVLTMALFHKLNTSKKIIYPPIEILIPEAGKMLENDLSATPTNEETEKISEILSRSCIDDIMEDENNILWKFRYYIRDFYQQSLPRILNSRPWNTFENAAKMQHLACGWPIDSDVIVALELLGSDFPDSDIRLLAVNSLSRIDWPEFSLYLLQICQCLKYESYLNSNFTQMILKRMMANAKIAQFMFYYLKVELSACDWCKVPFSAILYNYLQYSPGRCASLLKQYRATNEMCHQNKALKQFHTLEENRKAQALLAFHQKLSSDSCREIFDNLTCPLDCNITLKTFQPKICKFMDSKMRPIYLSWNVSVEFLKDYILIYKNGDDLRQDGLIIQMLHIMNSIWQSAGLDLKLFTYEVLACSKKEGYIQVVQNAETLANIYRFADKKNAKSEMNSKMLLFWLQSKNNSNDMTSVVKNFTSSCAAYCVATFILGIGDRHCDNIMIRQDGHFFHIDFGHVLGNFKRIMGGMISREWTKFILVQDFLYVIAKNDTQKEYEFKHLCTKGYLTLRKHSDLFLSLFKIMVNTGIPEISNMDDLNYLKDTFQIGKSEEEAQTYFQNTYEDTLRKNFIIFINWKAHLLRRVTN